MVIVISIMIIFKSMMIMLMILCRGDDYSNCDSFDNYEFVVSMMRVNLVLHSLVH